MDGILIIDKPAGLTSHDVVTRARRILRERRIGHTGTLDPFATGVLVLLVGRATRLAQFLHSDAKTYSATILFGYATDTGDLTGTPRPESYLQTKPLQEVTAFDRETALASLRGALDQTPPMYSAKKVQGRKLYELARAGEIVERKAVPVIIHNFAEATPDAWRVAADGATAELDVSVTCSAGTYIRVLAEDFGAKLGYGAHLTQLRRTAAGAFTLTQAVTLEQLAESGAAALQPLTNALPDLPAMRLTPDEVRRVGHGQALRSPFALADESPVALYAEATDELIAIGYYQADTDGVRPRIVLGTGD